MHRPGNLFKSAELAVSFSEKDDVYEAAVRVKPAFDAILNHREDVDKRLGGKARSVRSPEEDGAAMKTAGPILIPGFLCRTLDR